MGADIKRARAPIDATYVTQTANSQLTAEQALGALSTGLMRVTTTTGAVTAIADVAAGQVLTSGSPAAWSAGPTVGSLTLSGAAPALTLTDTTAGEDDFSLTADADVLTLASGATTIWQAFGATHASAGNVTFGAAVSVADEAYGAGWNGSLQVPTKNAVYDKIETLGGAPTDATYIVQTAHGSLSAEQALSTLATGLMQVTTTTGAITSVTTSAGIAGLISDETGSGALVFGTAPTFTTSIGVGTGAVAHRYVNTTIGAIGTLLSDDGTNYEGLTITPASGSVTLAAVTAGTGADNISLVLTPAGTGSVSLTKIVNTTAGTPITLVGQGGSTPVTNAYSAGLGVVWLQLADGGFLYGGSYSDFGVGLVGNAYYNSSSNWVYKATDEAALLDTYNGIIEFATAQSGTAGNTITWNTRYVIDNAGKHWWMTSGTPTAANREGVSLSLAAGSITLGAETNGTGSDNIDFTLTPAGTGTVKVNSDMSRVGANAQAIGIKHLTELTTIEAAATTDTAIQIPANAIVVGVSVRVTTVIPTAATFTVTGTTSATTFHTGASVSAAADTTNVGTTSCPYLNTTAQTIRITPNAQPADTTGRVRVTIHYLEITAPTS